MGGHHAILYATTVDKPVGTSGPCAEDDNLQNGFLGGVGGEAGGNLTLPEGVAFRLSAGSAIMMNTHFLNTTAETLDGESTIDIKFAEVDPDRKIASIFIAQWRACRREGLPKYKRPTIRFFVPKLTEAALEERRRHILRAAEICFARSGFRNTTIADVKREAGVSTGAVYTYFRSKEAMIRAILEAARDERRQQLTNAMSASGPVAQALVLFEWTMGIFGAQGQHSARLDVNLWAEALRSPRIGKLAREALEEATQAVSAVVAARLEAAGAAGAFDANTAASLMIALFLGLEVQTAVGMRVEASDVVQVLAKFFAEYLPDAAAKPRAKKKTKKTGQRRRRTTAAARDEDAVPPSAVTQRERP